MMGRIATVLAWCVLAPWGVPGDGPAGDDGPRTVIEGTVATGGVPVEGARILFCPEGRGLAFVEEATATTDARGRYRADLSGLPWSSGPLKAMVLAPGLDPDEQTVEPGEATVDFSPSARSWTEVTVLLEGGPGLSVAGSEVTCRVGSVALARLETDAEGRCRFVLAPELIVALSAEPEGARPVEAVLSVPDGGPTSVSLPVLPPYRGRVLDDRGSPLAGVSVGRWPTYNMSEGDPEMLPFFDGAIAETDEHGAFEIAPRVRVRADLSRAGLPEFEMLCFASPGLRGAAFRALDPTRAAEPIEVTLGRTRRVRIPIDRGAIPPGKQAGLQSIVWCAPDPDKPDRRAIALTGHEAVEAESGDLPTIGMDLPEGEFQVEVDLLDVDTYELLAQATLEVEVPPGSGPIDLPTLGLEPPRFEEMAGKPAPEIDATDLDTGEPVRLADYRGKVVVLDFWGHWCGPCLGAMPGLMDLHDAFEGRPLAILALHDRSAASRDDYERKIAAARRRFWGGRDLPFPVLLDRPDPDSPDEDGLPGTGATTRRYGVSTFPTLLVIGPDGRMAGRVPHSEHDRLESLVRTLVEEAEGR